MCVAGTRWVQGRLLEEHPDAALKVYAVWFNMLPADSRERWPDSLLTDPRVTHYWDEGKLAGRFFGEHVTAREPGHVEWDAYLLYGSEAEWKEQPEPQVSWGRTIVQSRERLQADLEPLLEAEP